MNVSQHNAQAAKDRYLAFYCGRCKKPFSECKCCLGDLREHVGHTSGVPDVIERNFGPGRPRRLTPEQRLDRHRDSVRRSREKRSQT